MNISNNISIFIDSQLPEFVRTNGPELTAFIRTYYEWMESTGNPVAATRQLPTFSDVDLAPDSIFSYFRNQFMQNFPRTVVDERILIKNILDFYKSRGSERSYRMLFRLLFGDDDISFYYPGNDILRASDGRWVVKRSIKCTVTDFSLLADLVEIRGEISGATARQDNIVSYLSNGVLINEMFLTHVFGTFQNNENIINQVTGVKVARTISELITYNGSWEGTNGFLSSDKKLEDNFYYQEFSYEIKSNVSLSEYQDSVYKLVHPTGTKLFAKLGVDISIDTSQINFSLIQSSITKISITLVSILDESPNIAIDSNIANNYVYINTPESITDSTKIVPWFGYKMFNEAMRDIPISWMNQDRFFVSNTSTFHFAIWTPINIKDTVHNVNNWYFAETIVNNSIIILNGKTEYPFGATDNLTYKYRIIS